ncbi:MAG: hypothetical protein KAY22_02390 [Rhizorhabdus sp.]|uniref:ankyrin repeat domain-containing protein n=1 Tax=Rhizorhabdus sp. TaxID=1968843 RepID=UPI001B3EB315|nr:ankyrin repeat domain-containing protein [Rhizorhabdus sp.]MBP8231130.1 hypothetical protein [Rhizorhabdus sp.]
MSSRESFDRQSGFVRLDAIEQVLDRLSATWERLAPLRAAMESSIAHNDRVEGLAPELRAEADALRRAEIARDAEMLRERRAQSRRLEEVFADVDQAYADPMGELEARARHLEAEIGPYDPSVEAWRTLQAEVESLEQQRTIALRSSLEEAGLANSVTTVELNGHQMFIDGKLALDAELVERAAPFGYQLDAAGRWRPEAVQRSVELVAELMAKFEDPAGPALAMNGAALLPLQAAQYTLAATMAADPGDTATIAAALANVDEIYANTRLVVPPGADGPPAPAPEAVGWDLSALVTALPVSATHKQRLAAELRPALSLVANRHALWAAYNAAQATIRSGGVPPLARLAGEFGVTRAGDPRGPVAGAEDHLLYDIRRMIREGNELLARHGAATASGRPVQVMMSAAWDEQLGGSGDLDAVLAPSLRDSGDRRFALGASLGAGEGLVATPATRQGPTVRVIVTLPPPLDRRDAAARASAIAERMADVVGIASASIELGQGERTARLVFEAATVELAIAATGRLAGHPLVSLVLSEDAERPGGSYMGDPAATLRDRLARDEADARDGQGEYVVWAYRAPDGADLAAIAQAAGTAPRRILDQDDALVAEALEWTAGSLAEGGRIAGRIRALTGVSAGVEYREGGSRLRDDVDAAVAALGRGDTAGLSLLDGLARARADRLGFPDLLTNQARPDPVPIAARASGRDSDSPSRNAFGVWRAVAGSWLRRLEAAVATAGSGAVGRLGRFGREPAAAFALGGREYGEDAAGLAVTGDRLHLRGPGRHDVYQVVGIDARRRLVTRPVPGERAGQSTSFPVETAIYGYRGAGPDGRGAGFLRMTGDGVSRMERRAAWAAANAIQARKRRDAAKHGGPALDALASVDAAHARLSRAELGNLKSAIRALGDLELGYADRRERMAQGISQAIGPQLLRRLDSCVAGPASTEELARAFGLGVEVVSAYRVATIAGAQAASRSLSLIDQARQFGLQVKAKELTGSHRAGRATLAQYRQDLLALARRINPTVAVEFVNGIFHAPTEENVATALASGATSVADAVHHLTEKGVAGEYLAARNLARLSIDVTSFDPTDTAAHEMWHSLETLLTEAEQRALATRFPATGTVTHIERTAYAFGAWAAARVRGEPIPLDVADKHGLAPAGAGPAATALAERGFETIEGVTAGVRASLRSAGVTSVAQVDAIFASALAGDIGKRAVARDRAAAAWPSIRATLPADVSAYLDGAYGGEAAAGAAFARAMAMHVVGEAPADPVIQVLVDHHARRLAFALDRGPDESASVPAAFDPSAMRPLHALSDTMRAALEAEAAPFLAEGWQLSVLPVGKHQMPALVRNDHSAGILVQMDDPGREPRFIARALVEGIAGEPGPTAVGSGVEFMTVAGAAAGLEAMEAVLADGWRQELTGPNRIRPFLEAARSAQAGAMRADQARYLELKLADPATGAAGLASAGFDVGATYWIHVPDDQVPTLDMVSSNRRMAIVYPDRQSAAGTGFFRQKVAPVYLRIGAVADLTDPAADPETQAVLKRFFEANQETLRDIHFNQLATREDGKRRGGLASLSDDDCWKLAQEYDYPRFEALIADGAWDLAVGDMHGDGVLALAAEYRDAGVSAMRYRMQDGTAKLAVLDGRDVSLAWDRVPAAIEMATAERAAERKNLEAYNAHYDEQVLAERVREREADIAAFDLAEVRALGFDTSTAHWHPVANAVFADLDGVADANSRGRLHLVYANREQALAQGHALYRNGEQEAVPVYARLGRLAEIGSDVPAAAGQVITAIHEGNSQVLAEAGIADADGLTRLVQQGRWNELGGAGPVLFYMVLGELRRQGFDSVSLLGPGAVRTLVVFEEENLTLALDRLEQGPVARLSTRLDGTPAIGMGPRTRNLMLGAAQARQLLIEQRARVAERAGQDERAADLRESATALQPLTLEEITANVRLLVDEDTIVLLRQGADFVAVDADARRVVAAGSGLRLFEYAAGDIRTERATLLSTGDPVADSLAMTRMAQAVNAAGAKLAFVSIDEHGQADIRHWTGEGSPEVQQIAPHEWADLAATLSARVAERAEAAERRASAWREVAELADHFTDLSIAARADEVPVLESAGSYYVFGAKADALATRSAAAAAALATIELDGGRRVSQIRVDAAGLDGIARDAARSGLAVSIASGLDRANWTPIGIVARQAGPTLNPVPEKAMQQYGPQSPGSRGEAGQNPAGQNQQGKAQTADSVLRNIAPGTLRVPGAPSQPVQGTGTAARGADPLAAAPADPGNPAGSRRDDFVRSMLLRRFGNDATRITQATTERAELVGRHKIAVTLALAEGRDIAPEVLADYLPAEVGIDRPTAEQLAAFGFAVTEPLYLGGDRAIRAIADGPAPTLLAPKPEEALAAGPALSAFVLRSRRVADLRPGRLDHDVRMVLTEWYGAARDKYRLPALPEFFALIERGALVEHQAAAMAGRGEAPNEVAARALQRDVLSALKRAGYDTARMIDAGVEVVGVLASGIALPQPGTQEDQLAAGAEQSTRPATQWEAPATGAVASAAVAYGQQAARGPAAPVTFGSAPPGAPPAAQAPGLSALPPLAAAQAGGGARSAFDLPSATAFGQPAAAPAITLAGLDSARQPQAPELAASGPNQPPGRQPMQQDSTPEARALEQRLGEIVAQLNELDPKTPPADIAALLAADAEPLGLARSEQLASLIYRDVGGEQAGVWPLQNGYVLFRDPQSGRMSAATMEAFGQMISPQGLLGRDPEAARRFPPQLLDAFLDYLDSGRATDPDFAADMNDLREEVQAIISEAAPGTSVELARRLYGEQATVTESGALGPDMQPVSGLYFDSLRLIAVSMDATRGDPAATAYYEAYRILEPLFSNSERQALASAMPLIEQALAGLDREEAQKEYDELRAALERTPSDHPSHARIKGQVEDQAALLAQAVKAEAAAGLPATVNQAARTREVFGRFAAAARRGEAEAIMARAVRLAASGSPAGSTVLPPAGTGRFGTHPRAGVIAPAPASASAAGRWQAAAARVREVGTSVLAWTGLFRKIDDAHERRDLKTFQQVVADSMRGAIAQRAEVFDTGSELSLREASRIARTANLPRLAQQYDQLSLRLRSRPISAKKLVEDLRQRITDDRIRDAVLACGFHRVADSADLGLLADTREKARKVLALATSPTPQRAAGRGRAGERPEASAARVGSRPLGGEPPVAAASPAAAQSGARPAGPSRRASELTIGFWTQAEFIAGAQQRRIPVGVVEKLGVGNVVQRNLDGTPVVDKVIYGPRDTPHASVSLTDPALSAGLPATLTDVQKRDAILQRAVQELHKRVLVAELQAGRRISEANLQTYPDLAPLVPAWLYNDRADVVAPRSRGSDVGIAQAVARIGERQLGHSPLQFALGRDEAGEPVIAPPSMREALAAARRLLPAGAGQAELQVTSAGLLARSASGAAAAVPAHDGGWHVHRPTTDGQARLIGNFAHPVDAAGAALALVAGGASDAEIAAAAPGASPAPTLFLRPRLGRWGYYTAPRPDALGGGLSVYFSADGRRFDPIGPAADPDQAREIADAHNRTVGPEAAFTRWENRLYGAGSAALGVPLGLLAAQMVDNSTGGPAIARALELVDQHLSQALATAPGADPAQLYARAIDTLASSIGAANQAVSIEMREAGEVAAGYLARLRDTGVDPTAAIGHTAGHMGVDVMLADSLHRGNEAIAAGMKALPDAIGDAAAALASHLQLPAWLATENLSTARELASQAVARAQAELAQFGAPTAREIYEAAEKQLSELVLSGDLWRNQDFGDADRVLVQSWDLALGHLRFLKEAGIDPDRAATYLRHSDAGTAFQPVADAAGTVVEAGHRAWNAAVAQLESTAHAGSILVGDVHVSAESALGRLAASGQEAAAQWLGVFEQQGVDLLRQGGEQLAVWQHELGVAGEAARSCIANAVPAALERPLGQRLFDFVTDAGAVDRVSTAVGRAVDACKAGAEKGGAFARLGQHAESLMQAAGDLATRVGVHLQAFRQAVEQATGVDAAILADHAKDMARAAGHAMGVQFALGLPDGGEASHMETHHAGHVLPAMRFYLGTGATAPGPAASLEEIARETLDFAVAKGLSPEAIAAAVPQVAARHGLALAVGAGISEDARPKRAATAKTVREAATTLARDAALAEALAEVGAMQNPVLTRAVAARKTIPYTEIVERRPRAIRLILEAGGAPVWFPADAIKIDAAASTVSGRASLIDRKVAEAARRDAGNRLISLPEAAWSGKRSAGYDVLFETDGAEPVEVRIFLPRSVLVEESAAPAWIVGRAVAEAMARLDIVLDRPESWTTLDLRVSDTGRPPVAMTAADIAAVAAPSTPARQLKLADQLFGDEAAEPGAALAEIGLRVAGILADHDSATAGLHEAIAAKDAEMVSAWLSAGADPNRTLDPASGPALHLAAGGDLAFAQEIVPILLAAGANPGQRRESDGASPLDVVYDREAQAARAGRDATMIRAELERIASTKRAPQLYFPEYNAQLVNAARTRSNEGFEIALARGADPNAIVSGRNTVMHLVASDLRLAAKLLPDLVREGGDLDAVGDDGRTVRRVLADATALATAAAPPDAVSALKRWLDRGHDATLPAEGSRERQGSLVELVGSMNPDLRQVRELLAGGQNIDERRREDGMTALHVAAERGDLDVAAALIDAGARPSVRDNRGLTPSEAMAAAAANIDLPSRLLQDRLELAERSPDLGETVGVTADIRSPLIEIDGTELDWAAAVNSFVADGTGPLEFRTAAIELQAGLPAREVTVSDDSDQVSLVFEVPRSEVAQTVERLSDHPDVDAVRVADGGTGLGADPVDDLATAINRRDPDRVARILAELKELGTAQQVVNTAHPLADGMAAVHNAAGKPEILRLILEAGGDPHLRTVPPGEGLQPLHFAARTRSPESARLLIDAGADPGAPDDLGYTPIGMAKANLAASAKYHAHAAAREEHRSQGSSPAAEPSAEVARLKDQHETSKRLVETMESGIERDGAATAAEVSPAPSAGRAEPGDGAPEAISADQAAPVEVKAEPTVSAVDRLFGGLWQRAIGSSGFRFKLDEAAGAVDVVATGAVADRVQAALSAQLGPPHRAFAPAEGEGIQFEWKRVSAERMGDLPGHLEDLAADRQAARSAGPVVNLHELRSAQARNDAAQAERPQRTYLHVPGGQELSAWQLGADRDPAAGMFYVTASTSAEQRQAVLSTFETYDRAKARFTYIEVPPAAEDRRRATAMGATWDSIAGQFRLGDGQPQDRQAALLRVYPAANASQRDASDQRRHQFRLDEQQAFVAASPATAKLAEFGPAAPPSAPKEAGAVDTGLVRAADRRNAADLEDERASAGDKAKGGEKTPHGIAEAVIEAVTETGGQVRGTATGALARLRAARTRSQLPAAAAERSMTGHGDLPARQPAATAIPTAVRAATPAVVPLKVSDNADRGAVADKLRNLDLATLREMGKATAARVGEVSKSRGPTAAILSGELTRGLNMINDQMTARGQDRIEVFRGDAAAAAPRRPQRERD